MKVVYNFLNDKIITDVLVAGDFAVLCDESTDEGECSWISVFVHFVVTQIHKAVELF